MAYTRTRVRTGITQFSPEDRYGRTSIPDTRGLISDKRIRRWGERNRKLFFRQKNGIYDPISFFHLVETLSTLKVNETFAAGDLAEHLNQTKRMFTWDAVTVGRMLNDLIESTQEANSGERQFQPLEVRRTWAGREYFLTDFPVARAVLFNLVDDLGDLAEQTLEAQGRGEYVGRQTSPLAGLPSLLTPETAM